MAQFIKVGQRYLNADAVQYAYFNGDQSISLVFAPGSSDSPSLDANIVTLRDPGEIAFLTAVLDERCVDAYPNPAAGFAAAAKPR